MSKKGKKREKTKLSQEKLKRAQGGAPGSSGGGSIIKPYP